MSVITPTTAQIPNQVLQNEVFEDNQKSSADGVNSKAIDQMTRSSGEAQPRPAEAEKAFEYDNQRTSNEETSGLVTIQPQLQKEPSTQRANESSCSQEVTDDESGYDGESDCSDMITDMLTCFGAKDECCPASGTGCFSTCLGFCTNILVSIR